LLCSPKVGDRSKIESTDELLSDPPQLDANVIGKSPTQLVLTKQLMATHNIILHMGGFKTHLLHFLISYSAMIFNCLPTAELLYLTIVHSALYGSEYPVCTSDAQVLFLSGARMLHTQHSAVQALPGGV
jgi:hypothetical protein